MNPHITLHIYNLKHIADSYIMSYFCHFGGIQSLNRMLKQHFTYYYDIFSYFVLISLKVMKCADFNNR